MVSQDLYAQLHGVVVKRRGKAVLGPLDLDLLGGGCTRLGLGSWQRGCIRVGLGSWQHRLIRLGLGSWQHRLIHLGSWLRCAGLGC